MPGAAPITGRRPGDLPSGKDRSTAHTIRIRNGIRRFPREKREPRVTPGGGPGGRTQPKQ